MGLSNNQRHLEVRLRYMVLKPYWEHATMMLVFVGAPTVGLISSLSEQRAPTASGDAIESRDVSVREVVEVLSFRRCFWWRVKHK